jgi:hypothetical protein
MAETLEKTTKTNKIIFQAKRPRQLDRKIDVTKRNISISDISFDEKRKESLLKSINSFLCRDIKSIHDTYSALEPFMDGLKDTILIITQNEKYEYQFEFYKEYSLDIGCVYWLDKNEDFKKWNKDSVLLLIHYYEIFTQNYTRWFDWYYERMKEYFVEDIQNCFNGEEEEEVKEYDNRFYDYTCETSGLIDNIKDNHKIKNKKKKELDNEITLFKEKYSFIYDEGHPDGYNNYIMFDEESFDFIIMIPDFEDMGNYINEMLNSKEDSGIKLKFKVNNCNQNTIPFIDDLEIIHKKLMEILK